MAFSWTAITAGSTTVLADHANQVRNNANTLITLMTANTGKCSAYSCSSLTSIPASVTTGSTIVYTSWLTDMKASVDRIHTSKYCAQAHTTQNTSHNPSKYINYLNAHKNTNEATYHHPHNASNLTTNNSSQCTTVYSTNHGSYHTTK